MSERILTGRGVFLITASAFAVIIGVNLVMAYLAVSTFPGLEVNNSYVASQQFEADRAAQLALGWQVTGAVDGDALRLSILDRAGQPVEVAELQTTLGRATHIGEDLTPDFEFDGRVYLAPVALAPGNWNLRLLARADDGTVFRQRVVLYVKQFK